MKEITVNVPEGKLEFIKELIANLGLTFNVKTVDNQTYQIPQWQKDMVQERINTASAKDYLPWQDAFKQINRK